METIFQYIAEYGFPVVLAIGVLWYCSRLIESHKEETDKFTEAINNNTIAITELKTMITAMLSNSEKGA